MNRHTQGYLGMVVSILFFIVVCALSVMSIAYDDTGNDVKTHSWELWSCDAPYGNYWVSLDGTSFLFGATVESALVESYTLKYLEGDILKTQIFSSTDPYFIVHLTDKDDMILERYQSVYRNIWGNEELRGPTIYHLYIPNPNSMEA